MSKEYTKRKGLSNEKCSAITKMSKPCSFLAIEGLGTCYAHTPDELRQQAVEITGLQQCVKNDGCRLPAVAGKPYCIKHGHYPPSVRRADAEREVEMAARAQLGALMRQKDVPVDIPKFETIIDPFDSLLQVASEVLAWKDTIRAKLAELHEDEWRWDGDRAGEQIRSEIVLYERSLDRCANILTKIARLNIEERLTRISERQQAIVEMAIVRTISEMGLSIEDQAKARKMIVGHLMEA